MPNSEELRLSSISIRKTTPLGARSKRAVCATPGSDLPGSARIFGVSIDPARSHEKFINKYQLPFPLLSDSTKEIVNAYGVWVEKSMYGKKYMGAERSTFVIDGAGKIAAIFRKVKPEEHATIVQEALSKLVSG